MLCLVAIFSQISGSKNYCRYMFQNVRTPWKSTTAHTCPSAYKCFPQHILSWLDLITPNITGLSTLHWWLILSILNIKKFLKCHTESVFVSTPFYLINIQSLTESSSGILEESITSTEASQKWNRVNQVMINTQNTQFP